MARAPGVSFCSSLPSAHSAAPPGSFSPKDYTLPRAVAGGHRNPGAASQSPADDSTQLRGDSLRRRRGLPPRHDAWAGGGTPQDRASRAAADVAAQFGILVDGEEEDGSRSGAGVALRARMAVGRTGCRATLSADSADQVGHTRCLPFWGASGVRPRLAFPPPQLARGFGDRWYRRWENNGWRPVTVKTLDEADKDPVHKLTADPRVRTLQCSGAAVPSLARRPSARALNRPPPFPQKPFHFSKLRRKSDLRLQCKQRKREWLRKLYLSGLAEERKDGGREEDEGEEGEGEEPGLEELLEWSEALDFDRYMQSWRAVGTSAPTEGPMLEEGEEAELLSETMSSAAGAAVGGL